MSNPKIKDLSIEILSDNWYTLKKATYLYQRKDGRWQEQQREAYDRGNGAGVLLCDLERKVLLLTRQFRLPTYINGNVTGVMIEVCAGLLDGDNPDDCIRKEISEETGYQITKVQRVMEAYMSPGSVTEVLYLYLASYTPDMKVSTGGGVEHEQEEIDSFELSLDEAMDMISSGKIKDAKTIMLIHYLALHGWSVIQ